MDLALIFSNHASTFFASPLYFSGTAPSLISMNRRTKYAKKSATWSDILRVRKVRGIYELAQGLAFLWLVIVSLAPLGRFTKELVEPRFFLDLFVEDEDCISLVLRLALKILLNGESTVEAHRIRRRHYGIRTEQAYVDWSRRFILFHGKRHPAEMEAVEVEDPNPPGGRGSSP